MYVEDDRGDLERWKVGLASYIDGAFFHLCLCCTAHALTPVYYCYPNRFLGFSLVFFLNWEMPPVMGS